MARFRMRPVLVALGTFGLLGGLYYGPGLVIGPQAHAQNSAVRDHVDRIAAAVDEYQAMTGGRFPEPHDWVGTLARNKLLAADRLPTSPWSREGQLEPLTIAPGDTRLVRASAIARGASPTPGGTPLGEGYPPREGRVDDHTFGAMLYDHDPASGVYVLYGIGRRKNHEAVVAHVVTNRKP
ncbi:hypothetical protein D3C72_438240 [compost metagenome]